MKQRNFNINFIIHSPFPDYASHIGGIAVAHTLANELQLLGENVYLYANTTDPRYNVPCIPWGTHIELDPRNTVVIIVAGAGEHLFEHHIPENLLQANVIRWLVHQQQKLYNEHEKLYMHNPYWNVIEGQRVDGNLCVYEIEDEIFKNKGMERSGTCYLIKGNLDTEPERAIHLDDDYCIDDILYSIPNLEKRNFLANLFNTKEYFITYTPMTFTSTLAAMCGCKTIIIPKKDDLDRESWLSGSWCNEYGIAYGLDDLDRAINTMDKVMPNVNKFKNELMPAQLNKFIDDCYKWLTEKYNINF
jgi:hypothetical protein